MSRYSVQPLPHEIAHRWAERLCALRKQRGYSQAKLAERSLVSLGNLKLFEQSGRISLINLLLLLDVLDRLRDLDDVLQPEPDPSRVLRNAKELDRE